MAEDGGFEETKLECMVLSGSGPGSAIYFVRGRGNVIHFSEPHSSLLKWYMRCFLWRASVGS